MAESFFSRLRRAEVGTHHHFASGYLAASANEMAWRENNRRVPNGGQYLGVTAAALNAPVSWQWKGYWQRSASLTDYQKSKFHRQYAQGKSASLKSTLWSMLLTGRAKPSGRRLSEHDASLVKGMVARGDRKHDIAAWFGVNQGRIAEVEHGHLHPDAEAAEVSELPPPGPYSSGQSTYAATEALRASRKALRQAIEDVEAALNQLEGGSKLSDED